MSYMVLLTELGGGGIELDPFKVALMRRVVAEKYGVTSEFTEVLYENMDGGHFTYAVTQKLEEVSEMIDAARAGTMAGQVVHAVEKMVEIHQEIWEVVSSLDVLVVNLKVEQDDLAKMLGRIVPPELRVLAGAGDSRRLPRVRWKDDES